MPTTRRKPVGKQLDAITDLNLKSFVESFLECALWSESDNKGNTWRIAEINQPTLESVIEQCQQFLTHCYAEKLLSPEPNYALMGQAGHDFALTRNGHGTGFWDREDSVYGEGVGDKLAELCGWRKMFEEFNVERYRRVISFSPLYNEPTQAEKYQAYYRPAHL